MTSVDNLDQDRKRDCDDIIYQFRKLNEEATKLELTAAGLQNEISNLEIELRAIDERNMKELKDNISVDLPDDKRKVPRRRQGRRSVDFDALLYDIQDALEGLEFGFKLGNDVQKRPLKALDGNGNELSFRNPADRQAVIDRKARASEQLEQVDARYRTILQLQEEYRRRYSARRCRDFNYPPALLMHLPPLHP